MPREQFEVRHSFVCARDYKIDLIRFCSERGIVASEHSRLGHASVGRRGFEGERQSLDGTEAPGDSRREKWIDECERMRHQRPPLTRAARETVLNYRPIRDRHDRRCLGKRARERRIPL